MLLYEFMDTSLPFSTCKRLSKTNATELVELMSSTPYFYLLFFDVIFLTVLRRVRSAPYKWLLRRQICRKVARRHPIDTGQFCTGGPQVGALKNHRIAGKTG